MKNKELISQLTICATGTTGGHIKNAGFTVGRTGLRGLELDLQRENRFYGRKPVLVGVEPVLRGLEVGLHSGRTSF